MALAFDPSASAGCPRPTAIAPSVDGHSHCNLRDAYFTPMPPVLLGAAALFRRHFARV